MTDVSGIPNMGFGGGGYFGGSAALGLPAMSANQINAGIWGNYSPGAAQATQANIYGAGGFGAQPAYYAGLGAAYGRQTGGFGGYGAANADPFTPVGGGGSQGAPQYDPWTGAITGYNAPRQYGWDANEGAPAPAAPQVFNRGEFNPQTYGWDHNEGAPAYTPPAQPNWNDLWKSRIAPQVPTFPSSVTVPQQQSGGFGMNLGSNQGMPQYDPWTGAITGYSGGGGYDMSAQSRAYQSPLQGFDWAQSYMPNFSTGGAMQQALLASQYQPFNTGGGYNPWGSNNTRTPDYASMYGYPNSGYLGVQTPLYQDPFSGYRNPADMLAGGGFPGNYQQGNDARPLNSLPLGWNNSFNN
jgi:hypothetical protein